LAWALSIDNWDSSWPIATRRAVVANAIPVHRKKGTVQAVRNAISAFGANMALREWWETSPQGTRGTFTVILSAPDDGSGAPSAAIVNAIVSEIDRAKPLSRHFTFGLSLAGKAQVGLIAAARPAAYFRYNFSA
jgi:phage tail P2-like protein